MYFRMLVADYFFLFFLKTRLFSLTCFVSVCVSILFFFFLYVCMHVCVCMCVCVCVRQTGGQTHRDKERFTEDQREEEKRTET